MDIAQREGTARAGTRTADRAARHDRTTADGAARHDPTLRIGFVADDLYPGFGGQAAASQAHIDALLARGHAVRVVAGRDRSPVEPPDGVALRRLPAWRYRDVQTQLALPSPSAVAWLVAWADVIQVNTPTPLALLACMWARAAGVPAVVGVHTQIESATHHLRRGRTLAERSLGTWYRTLYAAADALTAPTEFAARLARRSTGRPVHVVSNGVTLPDRVDRLEARNEVFGRLGLASGKRLAAYVGRLAPEKRPLDLVDLVARLPDTVHLAVAGTGPLAAELRARSRAPGLHRRMSVLGWIDEREKGTLLAAADLFLMPSPTELQSIAALEALAHGTPVVAAAHPTSAVPELVTGLGAGIAYDPGEPDAAAQKIAALLGDDERLAALRVRALAGAREHDVAHSAERLERVYADLIGRKTGAS